MDDLTDTAFFQAVYDEMDAEQRATGRRFTRDEFAERFTDAQIARSMPGASLSPEAAKFARELMTAANAALFADEDRGVRSTRRLSRYAPRGRPRKAA